MAAQWVSVAAALQLLVVAAERIAIERRAFINANESQGVAYCDNKCPEGMTLIQKLEALVFPALDEADLNVMRCSAEGVQDGGYPPYFVLNSKVNGGSAETTFYNVGRLDLLSVMSAVFQQAFADDFHPEREKTEGESSLEEQIKEDYESQQVEFDHPEVIGHWLVEEGASQATKYGLKNLAYNVVGYSSAASLSGAVSALAGLVGIARTFPLMFFPVTFATQWGKSVPAKSGDTPAERRSGAYLYYKHPWVLQFSVGAGLQMEKVSSDYITLCGEDTAKAMLTSMRETAAAVEGLLKPFTQLGACTAPVVTQGPGGNKVEAKVACMQQVWDILPLGPMYPAAKMAVLYGAIADQFVHSWGSILKNAFNVQPGAVPNVLESIEQSPDREKACQLSVKMDGFYRALFQKLAHIIVVWNRSFLREYGTNMVCTRKCKAIINSWTKTEKRTCDSAPPGEAGTIAQQGTQDIFTASSSGDVPWGTFTGAFKKVVLNME